MSLLSCVDRRTLRPRFWGESYHRTKRNTASSAWHRTRAVMARQAPSTTCPSQQPYTERATCNHGDKWLNKNCVSWRLHVAFCVWQINLERTGRDVAVCEHAAQCSRLQQTPKTNKPSTICIYEYIYVYTHCINIKNPTCITNRKTSMKHCLFWPRRIADVLICQIVRNLMFFGFISTPLPNRVWLIRYLQWRCRMEW